MVAMAETRPEVKEIRCEGTQKNGHPCGYLMARIHGRFGRIELKCPKCHTDRVVE
jgi:hypothetical protein